MPDVDSRGPEVQVAVSEGVVRVEAGGKPAVRLAAGERLAYRGEAAPGPVQPLDLDSASAWQRGKLIFNQRPLGEVLAELERYLPGRILLTDASLRRHKVSGVFDLDDPDALLQTLQRMTEAQEEPAAVKPVAAMGSASFSGASRLTAASTSSTSTTSALRTRPVHTAADEAPVGAGEKVGDTAEVIGRSDASQ